MCFCSSTLHLVLCLFTSSKMKLLIEVKPQLFLQGRRMEWGAAFSDCWFFQKHFASSTPNMSPGLEFRGEDCLGCASQPPISPWGPSVCSHPSHSASIYEILNAWDVMWVLCDKNTHNMKFTILII